MSALSSTPAQALKKPIHGPSAAAVAAIKTSTGNTTSPPTTKAAIASSGANCDRAGCEITEETKPTSAKSRSDVYCQASARPASAATSPSTAKMRSRRPHPIGGAVEVKRFSGIGDGLHDGRHAADRRGRIDRLQRFFAAALREAVEESEQIGFVAFDFPFIDAAEMPDQLRRSPAMIFPVHLRRRLEGEIALGIRAHRAIVEVGRTDAQDAIVDDHHLAVHHDRGRPVRIARRWIEKANPVHDAGRDELLDESAAAALHGLRFEPGRMQLRRDDQDAKLRHVQHPLRQQLRDVDGAGKLVLDIDEAVGRVDGGLEQPRDFVHAGVACGCDPGPGDARRHVRGIAPAPRPASARR